MDVTNEEHSNDVLRELNDLREQAELTDVVLEVEGRSFPCHRAVLASCSPYFCTMFTSSYAEAKQERVSIKDVSGVAMATILDYAYTGCLQTEPDQVQDVMSAARLLQMSFVSCKAAEYMEKHLDMCNCADVLMYADMLADSTLTDASERYIASRFNHVALQPSFLKLSLPLLQSLLDRDDLMTNSEDDVVQAALRWIGFNEEERLQHLPALCRSFRHSFISSNQHVEIQSKCPSTDSKLVYSKSTTQRLGQMRSEMQISLKKVYFDDDSQLSACCYDPSTGGMYAIDMPDNLKNGFSVTVTPEDELYLAGGINSSWNGMKTFKTFYQYNHLLKTWERRCDMISPRAWSGLVYLKGYIYAIGGYDTKVAAERYDPSRDEWTSIAPLPHPMYMLLAFCAVTLDDSVYVISKEGCYSYSTTENMWNKIADMIQPPVHLQAITYQGRIFCIDCKKECRESSRTCVEMYDPTNGLWKQSGNGKSFIFEQSATLMKHGGTLYLITVHDGNDQNHWTWGLPKKNKTYVHQYQPETDSWLLVEEKGRLVPPLKWLRYDSRIDYLVARLIPSCLGDWTVDENLPLAEMLAEEGEQSDNTFSDPSGNGITDDSEDDLSDQGDSDEDNSDEERESGSDDGDI
ncbi:kelch repeat and BTB domain-containing protein 2-like isoform X1 [Branchiostoma lanceolatum]|uniref:kelch repeat and BTB domain-containing protein 2-like isoform X1 n=1 Tax=Branchiostoma lanceolatum TaxID=7740 RepID=UPI003456E08D